MTFRISYKFIIILKRKEKEKSEEKEREREREREREKERHKYLQPVTHRRRKKMPNTFFERACIMDTRGHFV